MAVKSANTVQDLAKLSAAKEAARQCLLAADKFLKESHFDLARQQLERAKQLDPTNVYIYAFQDRIAYFEEQKKKGAASHLRAAPGAGASQPHVSDAEQTTPPPEPKPIPPSVAKKPTRPPIAQEFPVTPQPTPDNQKPEGTPEELSKEEEKRALEQLKKRALAEREAAEKQRKRELEARAAAEEQRRREVEARTAAEEQRQKEAEARSEGEEERRQKEGARIKEEERRKELESRAAAEERLRIELEARVAEEERKRRELEERVAEEDRKRRETEARSPENYRRRELETRAAEEHRRKELEERIALEEGKRRELEERAAQEERRRKEVEAQIAEELRKRKLQEIASEQLRKREAEARAVEEARRREAEARAAEEQKKIEEMRRQLEDLTKALEQEKKAREEISKRSLQNAVKQLRAALAAGWANGAPVEAAANALHELAVSLNIPSEVEESITREVKLDMYSRAVKEVIAKRKLLRSSSSTLEWLRKVYQVSVAEYLENESKFLLDLVADQYKGTVLLVSKSIGTKEDITPRLKSTGYAVVQAETPEVALEKIEKVNPNLILCDTHFPNGLSGIKFLHVIRANPKFNFVPFILIGEPSELALLQSSELKPNEGVIKRPIDYDELTAAMNEKLEYFREYISSMA